jgi:hypothetical protein
MDKITAWSLAQHDAAHKVLRQSKFKFVLYTNCTKWFLPIGFTLLFYYNRFRPHLQTKKNNNKASMLQTAEPFSRV